MGLIACVRMGNECDGYRPRLKKGSPKRTGKPGQRGTMVKTSMGATEPRPSQRVTICVLLCVFCYRSCCSQYLCAFLFKEINTTVPYNFVSFTGVVTCHFLSLVPLTFTHTWRDERRTGLSWKFEPNPTWLHFFLFFVVNPPLLPKNLFWFRQGNFSSPTQSDLVELWDVLGG